VALAGVGAMQSGNVQAIRIAAASLFEIPARLPATEAELLGHALTSDRIQAARKVLLQEVRPIDDIRSTASYRAYVAANLLEEFLQQMAASDAATGPSETISRNNRQLRTPDASNR